jgi:hypothetical protein
MEEITLYLCKESNRWGVKYVAYQSVLGEY